MLHEPNGINLAWWNITLLAITLFIWRAIHQSQTEINQQVSVIPAGVCSIKCWRKGWVNVFIEVSAIFITGSKYQVVSAIFWLQENWEVEGGGMMINLHLGSKFSTWWCWKNSQEVYPARFKYAPMLTHPPAGSQMRPDNRGHNAICAHIHTDFPAFQYWLSSREMSPRPTNAQVGWFCHEECIDIQTTHSPLIHLHLWRSLEEVTESPISSSDTKDSYKSAPCQVNIGSDQSSHANQQLPPFRPPLIVFPHFKNYSVFLKQQSPCDPDLKVRIAVLTETCP